MRTTCNIAGRLGRPASFGLCAKRPATEATISRSCEVPLGGNKHPFVHRPAHRLDTIRHGRAAALAQQSHMRLKRTLLDFEALCAHRCAEHLGKRRHIACARTTSRPHDLLVRPPPSTVDIDPESRRLDRSDSRLERSKRPQADFADETQGHVQGVAAHATPAALRMNLPGQGLKPLGSGRVRPQCEEHSQAFSTHLPPPAARQLPVRQCPPPAR